VAQSAMSWVAPSPVGSGVAVDGGDGSGCLREAVLGGPASGAPIEDGLRSGLLAGLAGGDTVGEALTRAGHVDGRRRVLTGVVTVVTVLGLCLFRSEGYDSVLARVLPLLPGVPSPGAPVPTGSALSQARTRLHGDALGTLFTASAGAGNDVGVPGVAWLGLELTVFDGTVVDLAATPEIAAQFAIPSGGRFPQARLVTLASCGTRRVRAAAVDSCAVSEQALVDRLTDALRPGTLNLADRNFFAMHRWIAFAATGAHLAWRVKNGAKSLPAKVIKVLADGSQLVRLRESDSMFHARRRATDHADRARLPDTIARLVEFTLAVTDRRGATRTSRFRILTTLLDHHTHPARAIAALYAERWQAEVVYYRLKVTLRGPDVRLRGQTSALARQEIWGLLIVYNALCDLATQTAVSLGVDPDEISFVAVLRLTRTHLGADTGCRNCGHRPADPVDTLITAIAAHPRNRPGRQRTSPRSKKHRRTEHTRDVSYTIEIVPSNLSKVE
jgi:hypothetical protein